MMLRFEEWGMKSDWISVSEAEEKFDGILDEIEAGLGWDQRGLDVRKPGEPIGGVP